MDDEFGVGDVVASAEVGRAGEVVGHGEAVEALDAAAGVADEVGVGVVVVVAVAGGGGGVAARRRRRRGRGGGACAGRGC